MSKTVRVRIAVAVDDSGQWSACGWRKDKRRVPDFQLSENAAEGVADE